MQIANDLELKGNVITEIEADLRARLEETYESKGRFLDTLKASGEDNNAKLIAAI